MQDIDFGKVFKPQKQQSRKPVRGSSRGAVSPPAESNSSAWWNRLTYAVCITIVAFTLGLVSGMRFEKYKMTQKFEQGALGAVKTANTGQDAAVAPGEVKAPERPIVPDKMVKDSYIILAKTYPNRREATRAGLPLKQKGLPVFLAESGHKMKLYIGPIAGKTPSWNMLERVKKAYGFTGAILYKK